MRKVIVSNACGQLTDYHMNPLHSTQDRAVLNDILIGSEKNLELSHADLILQTTSLCGITLVGDHVDAGRPLCELVRPIRHGRQGHNDEVWTTLPLDLYEERDQRDGLDGLAETLQEATVRSNIKAKER